MRRKYIFPCPYLRRSNINVRFNISKLVKHTRHHTQACTVYYGHYVQKKSLLTVHYTKHFKKQYKFCRKPFKLCICKNIYTTLRGS